MKTVQTDVPQQLYAAPLARGAWLVLREVLRRFLEVHRPHIMDEFVRKDRRVGTAWTRLIHLSSSATAGLLIHLDALDVWNDFQHVPVPGASSAGSLCHLLQMFFDHPQLGCNRRGRTHAIAIWSSVDGGDLCRSAVTV